MTSPPPEPYFADGLLQRWWAGLKCTELRNYLQQPDWYIRDYDAIGCPLLTISQVDAWIIYERIGERDDDHDWNEAMGELGAMIRAELAGAGRAREKAEERLRVAVGESGTFFRGAEYAAREILEAFDGK